MKNIQIIFPFFLLFFISCNTDDPKEYEQQYCWLEIIEFESSIVSHDGVDDNGYFINSKSISEKGIVEYKKIGLIFAVNETKKMYTTTYKKSFNDEMPECIPKFIDSIKNIIILSNSDYNSNYKAGDTLNNIIKLTYSTMNSSDKKHDFPIFINDYLQTNPESRYYHFFIFTEAPDSNRFHQFTISYEENNGRKFNYSFPEVYIKKEL